MGKDIKYWSNVGKRFLYVIVTIVGIYLGYKCAIFYLPFLIAFIIAQLMEPAIRLIMKKFKFTRKLSAIIIFIITFGLIIGAVIWGLATIISESANLLQGLNNYTEKAYIQIQEIIKKIDISKIKISNEILNIIQNSSKEILNNLSIWGSRILGNTLNIVTQIPRIAIYLVITILSLYFICIDKIYILDLAEHHMPKSWVKRMGKHIREITQSLGGYLRAELTLLFVSFIISLVGLYIFMFVGLNIRYPLLIALVTAFVDALPILGSGTIMIPWAIISALDGDLTLGIAIIVLWIIMCIVRQVLEPKLVSKKIGIHPIFTLIAMYTGYKLIGIMGMLIGPIVLIIFKSIFSSLIEQGLIKTILDRN